MVVGVLVELSATSLDKEFDYLVPDSMIPDIKKGIRVLVPFGNRVLTGFILEIKDDSSYSDKLKYIKEIIDKDIVLNDEMLSLGKRIQKDTLSTLISAYQIMLPKALKASTNRSVNKKYITYYRLNKSIKLDDYKFNSTQQKIIDMCKTATSRDKLIDVSISSLNTLIKKNILISEKHEEYRLNYENKNTIKHKLTNDQQKVYEEILSYKDDKPCLLYGVTGSGKTEVYMELIDHFLKKNKTAIVLVPEISLTAQLINRFIDRFGDKIAALHSALSDGEKYDEWRRIERGEAKVVIGARSAIFAPLKDIGVIIIDEEHSDSYKQSDMNPRYNAKDVAIIRAKTHKAVLVMGSATPSLEVMARARKGVFHLLELNSRVNGSTLPKVNIVDMNKEIRTSYGHFSRILLDKIKEKIENGEQIILLLNRRGYSPVVMCKNCGHTFKCPNCDITYTYHKSNNMLICHYCGYAEKLPTDCPECHNHSISDIGVGTERIEEELKKYTNARVLRMDYDTTTRKGAHQKMIDAFKNHEYDILLGTQMVSKGLDFPLVTLVGVINADTSLNIPDFRSSEVTFSLLNQVSGRAGRSEIPGEVIIQTYNPDHYAVKYAACGNYLDFYLEEMKIRKVLKYPPYCYICYLRISGKDNTYVNNEANKIKRSLERNIDEVILGPSASAVFRLNNVYRYGIIIKYRDVNNIVDIIHKIQEHYQNNNKIKIDIDFNPTHLM